MNAGGPAGQLIDGRFELLERLGGGGMGLVWRARDTMLQREVALKEVRPADQAFQDEDPVTAHMMRERVLREARALARLHHPNVVTIYHIVDSVELRHPWLVMELVTGGSLADRLNRGPLLPQEAARVGRGVLAALTAAHLAGIQHRDVKPANVLLRPDGTPVLTDFGIAALRESTSSTNLTATGALIGSPEYIAPERIRGQEGDPASDLWSLGMLLYVAVEGSNPLRRDTTLATLAAVLDAPIPQPVRCGPLTPVLAALLVRDPAARPDAARVDQLLAAAERGVISGATGGAMGGGYGSAIGYTAGPSDAPYESGPSGAQYRSSPQGASYASFGVPYGPTDPSAAVLSPPPQRRSRRNSVFASCVAGTAAVGLIAALVWTLHNPSASASTQGAGGPSASTTTSASAVTGGLTATGAAATATATSGAVQGQSLLTEAGMRTLISAVRAKSGATKIVTMTVYPTYADVQVPTKADPTLYDEYLYRSGSFESWDHGTIDSTEGTVDPDTFTWSALPALLRYAQNNLKIAHPTSEYLIISGNWFDDGPAICVYLSDAYGSAYLEADPQGHVRKTYPRGS
jgi:serine/threonine protein kinase